MKEWRLDQRRRAMVAIFVPKVRIAVPVKMQVRQKSPRKIFGMSSQDIFGKSLLHAVYSWMCEERACEIGMQVYWADFRRRRDREHLAP